MYGHSIYAAIIPNYLTVNKLNRAVPYVEKMRSLISINVIMNNNFIYFNLNNLHSIYNATVPREIAMNKKPDQLLGVIWLRSTLFYCYNCVASCNAFSDAFVITIKE